MNLVNSTCIKLLLLGLAIVLIYVSVITGQTPNHGHQDQLSSSELRVSVSTRDNGSLATIKSKESAIIASTPENHDQSVLPQTHLGTQIDGALAVSENGQLVLNQGVRDFFDYFLSAADEIGAEAAIAEIQRYIQDYLPSPASDQANSLLWSYLHYKKFELNLQQQPLSGSLNGEQDTLLVLRENFQKLAVKRRELFSSEVDQALFGLEQQYQQHTLSTLELFADQTITQEERQTELARLQNKLPPELQASHEIDQEQRQQQRKVEAITVSNNDDSTFHQALLDQGLEQQKADELVSYRQQQVQFGEAYRQYRIAASKLDSQDKNYSQKLMAMRNTFFSQPEQQTQAKLRDLDKN